MDYKDCIIVYKTGKGIYLRATKLTVLSADKFAIVYNGDDVMAIVPFDEIKTIMFCDMADAQALMDVIGAKA